MDEEGIWCLLDEFECLLLISSNLVPLGSEKVRSDHNLHILILLPKYAGTLITACQFSPQIFQDILDVFHLFTLELLLLQPCFSFRESTDKFQIAKLCLLFSIGRDYSILFLLLTATAEGHSSLILCIWLETYLFLYVFLRVK